MHLTKQDWSIGRLCVVGYAWVAMWLAVWMVAARSHLERRRTSVSHEVRHDHRSASALTLHTMHQHAPTAEPCVTDEIEAFE